MAPRVTAAPGQRVDAFALAENEPLLELVLEEIAAVLAALGEIEGQGGQRIDDPEVAHLLAVDRFDADDGDHDLRRHAVQGLGLIEPLRIGTPEGSASADAHRLDEAGPVGRPVLRRPRRRRHDVAGHARDVAGLAQCRGDPGRVELASSGRFGGEAHHVVAAAVGDEVGRGVVDDAGRPRRARLCAGLLLRRTLRGGERRQCGRRSGNQQTAAQQRIGHRRIIAVPGHAASAPGP